jgi:hypothetical protein
MVKALSTAATPDVDMVMLSVAGLEDFLGIDRCIYLCFNNRTRFHRIELNELCVNRCANQRSGTEGWASIH